MVNPTAADGVLEVDVLQVSDLRLTGGTAASVTEEVRAQAAAGFRTALLHVDGPLKAAVTPFNPHIRRCLDEGLAELVLPGRRVRARVVVVRHPAVLQHGRLDATGVQAERLVLVANSTPRGIDGYRHYTVAGARAAALQHFGVEPRWAPIGPLVRAELAAELAGQQVLEQDWVNIIDVDAWAVPRTGVPGRPVIGRHSRDNPQKWPADAATLAQVYPTDGSVEVRVLGGARPAQELLGRLPDSWRVHPFGAMAARDFVAGLDFFVYYHHPRWVEAFGRTILEALASGAVAVLPPHFEPVFGPAATYAEPAGVRAVVDRLTADPEAYRRASETGREVARERFGHEAHQARLTALIGPPGGTSARQAPVARHTPTPAPLRVLMVSSNGAGMGHLTRLLAYARRAGEQVAPSFLSISQAVPIVGRLGYPYEYVPSAAATGMVHPRWRAYFHARLTEVVGRLRPHAVVFDGTSPYSGIRDTRADHPGVQWVWSRRGMWYPGLAPHQLAKEAWFDLVLEPGDLAAPVDRGVTAEVPATRVGPVTLLDREDVLERASARERLGLEPGARTALVTLGAGNINDAGSATRVVIDALQTLDLEICVTQPAIAERLDGGHDGVRVVRHYPLSELSHAFDVAVSAAGYNSYHELLRFGVPTLFLPNLHTSLDDQRARARYAADQGWCHSLDEPTRESVTADVEDLLVRGPDMVAGVAPADPGNGAADAMAHIARMAKRGRR